MVSPEQEPGFNILNVKPFFCTFKIIWGTHMSSPFFVVSINKTAHQASLAAMPWQAA